MADITLAVKRCPSCQTSRPIEMFSPAPTRRDGRAGLCKPCYAVLARKWRAKNPDRARAQRASRDNAAVSRRFRAAHPDASRQDSAARRARLRGATVDIVKPFEIAERDHWTCALCSEAIPLVAKWPHPLSLSIDHVVPLAKGGAHAASNVQASHLRCNLRKYTKAGLDG